MRFFCVFRSKNIIVLHDVNIAALTGFDVDKLKTLARGENTVCKVFASTASVTPVWVAYTSNERLFKHTIPAVGNKLPQVLNSHADETVAKRKVSLENMEAVRARFLEANVHTAPKQLQRDLDTCGSFSRDHLILGCFDRALETLEKYSPDEFHSAHLPAYIVSALAKNLDRMESTMCCSPVNASSSDVAAPVAAASPIPEEPMDKEAPDCSHQHRKRVEMARQKFGVTLYQ